MRILGSGGAYRPLGMLAVVGLVLAGCTSAGYTKTVNTTATAVVTCRDSPGQQGKDTQPARLVNGVDGFIGDTNAYDTLPVRNQGGHRYLVWKTALAVAPTALPYRTVSVLSPESARLAYGSARLAHSVRLPVCGERYTLYTGGVFVMHAACVTLAVGGPTGRLVTVTVPILVTKC